MMELLKKKITFAIIDPIGTIPVYLEVTLEMRKKRVLTTYTKSL